MEPPMTWSRHASPPARHPTLALPLLTKSPQSFPLPRRLCLGPSAGPTPEKPTHDADTEHIGEECAPSTGDVLTARRAAVLSGQSTQQIEERPECRCATSRSARGSQHLCQTGLPRATGRTAQTAGRSDHSDQPEHAADGPRASGQVDQRRDRFTSEPLPQAHEQQNGAHPDDQAENHDDDPHTIPRPEPVVGSRSVSLSLHLSSLPRRGRYPPHLGLGVWSSPPHHVQCNVSATASKRPTI